jgi:hypothetical protein
MRHVVFFNSRGSVESPGGTAASFVLHTAGVWSVVAISFVRVVRSCCLLVNHPYASPYD